MGRGRSFGTAGWVLTVLIGCAGCATPFNPKDAAAIQSISFSGFDEPKYELTAFSPIRLLASDIAGHPDFPDQMAKQNLYPGAEMKAAMAKELRTDGYNVLEGDGTGDAVLNFEFGGFPPATTPAYSAGAVNYEPEFMATATLRDAKSRKALFQRVYVYRDNSFAPMDGSLLIRPDPKYGFKTALDAYANPELAAEGLRAAEPLIAQSIGVSLKRQ